MWFESDAMCTSTTALLDKSARWRGRTPPGQLNVRHPAPGRRRPAPGPAPPPPPAAPPPPPPPPGLSPSAPFRQGPGPQSISACAVLCVRRSFPRMTCCRRLSGRPLPEHELACRQAAPPNKRIALVKSITTDIRTKHGGSPHQSVADSDSKTAVAATAAPGGRSANTGTRRSMH